MKIDKKSNQGVTLVALTITIILMIIIASIVIYDGRKTIKEAQLESLKTNMMLIEAKARECVEKANFEMGIAPDDTKKTKVRETVYGGAGLVTASDAGKEELGQNSDDIIYEVTPTTLKNWGLDKIELEDGEKYYIEFYEDTAKVEIYNNIGFDDKYSLTEINAIDE